MKTLTLALMALISSNFLIAQSTVTTQEWLGSSVKGKVFNELPVDLDVETVVFLEYEQLEIDPTMSKQYQKMYQRRNENYFPSANEMLHDNAEKYPFQYVISKRSEHETWKEKGYKYVYECEIMRLYNNGVNLYAGKDNTWKIQQHDGSFKSADVEYVANMYLIDLETGDKFKVFKMDQDYAMYYKGIISKLVKKVEKEFDL